MESGPVIGVDGGARLQDGIGIGVAGEEDERNLSRGAERGQFIDAILALADDAALPDLPPADQ